MCLQTLWTKKEQKKITDKIKNGEMIYVYKIVGVTNKDYRPISTNTMIPFTEGMNETDPSVRISISRWYQKSYRAGYHFFYKRKDAVEVLKLMKEEVIDYPENKAHWTTYYSYANEIIFDHYKIIRCQIKKSWITAIGLDGGQLKRVTTIVAKKAIFPKYQNREKIEYKEYRSGTPNYRKTNVSEAAIERSKVNNNW